MLPVYEEPVFRPPSEGLSLIFQVTIGCSWNKCTFCEMYTSKQFRPRPAEAVEKEIREAAKSFSGVEKVFLADGDALVLSNKRLLPILELLYNSFPHLRQVTSYAMPANLLNKSIEDLRELREAGLNMVYYGVESGDPIVLAKIQKGATPEEILAGMDKAHEAGFIVSTTNLLGVGGRKYTEQHARHTADLLSRANPRYISFLTVMCPLGEDRFRHAFGDDYEELNKVEILQELHVIVENLSVRNSVFRSNHASNYLPLRGDLPGDKEKLLAMIDAAIRNPELPNIRPEFMRGL